MGDTWDHVILVPNELLRRHRHHSPILLIGGMKQFTFKLLNLAEIPLFCSP